MECLNEPLQRCDKNALVGIVNSLFVEFQGILEHYVDHPEENNGELDSECVKTIVQEALLNNVVPICFNLRGQIVLTFVAKRGC